MGPALPLVPESLGTWPTRPALSLFHALPSPPKAREEGRAGGQDFPQSRKKAAGQMLSSS